MISDSNKTTETNINIESSKIDLNEQTPLLEDSSSAPIKDDANVSKSDDRWWRWIPFGMPMLPYIILMVLLGTYLPKSYVELPSLRSDDVALGLAIVSALGALTEPLVGYVSDATTSKMGRRRPYILLSLPLMIVAPLLLAGAPLFITDQRALVLAFIGAQLLWTFGSAVFGSAYSAMAMHVTFDRRQRLYLYASMFLLSQLGSLAGQAMPLISEGTYMFEITAGSCAAMLLIALTFVALYRHETPPGHVVKPDAMRNVPMASSLLSLLRNDQFRALLLMSVAGSLSLASGQLLPFYLQYCLRNDTRWVYGVNSVIGVLLIAVGAMLGTPLWSTAGARFGKKRALLLFFFLRVANSVMLFFARAFFDWKLVTYCIVDGLLSPAEGTLLDALYADVADYDEFRTGVRREATLQGMVGIVSHMTGMIGVALPYALLAPLGYDSGNATMQSVRFVENLRLLFAFGAMPATVLMGLLLLRVRITPKTSARIKTALKKRALGELVQDPVHLGAATYSIPSMNWRLEAFFSWELGVGSAAALQKGRLWTQANARIVSVNASASARSDECLLSSKSSIVHKRLRRLLYILLSELVILLLLTIAAGVSLPFVGGAGSVAGTLVMGALTLLAGITFLQVSRIRIWYNLHRGDSKT